MQYSKNLGVNYESTNFPVFHIHFEVRTFDFFARREESVEEKNPGTYVARLASTFFLVYFVVQTLLEIGLRAKPVPRAWHFMLIPTHFAGASVEIREKAVSPWLPLSGNPLRDLIQVTSSHE